MQDSQEYLQKKAFFSSFITLYGRNVVLEILEDPEIEIHKLHLSSSNKPEGAIEQILTLATKRNIEIAYHDKAALSRISKNAKQDQGVAIDIKTKSYQDAKEIKNLSTYRMIALDGIQNPQNLGMIIRSCAAGNIDGVILPKESSAKISPLVIKASAGTLFKIPIYYCTNLQTALKLSDAKIVSLSAHAKKNIYDFTPHAKTIFVLGNESEGISKEVELLCNESLCIPMNRGVESLNVAISAALLAFMR